MVEFYTIDWTHYGDLVSDLTEAIKSSGQEFDLVIGIARGGIPVAMVIADQLGVSVDIINVKSYIGIAKRNKPKIISTLTENVKGKKVLVVDDLVDEGDTMETVLSFLKKARPAKLMTAVLFKKPWSRFDPDFCLKVVDKWVVFPWEHGEVGRIRLAMKAAPKGLSTG
ncbi:MAG: phosphoribosyltransferase [Thaumarchaeota archaeon]|nr:phosphoribosyltransferase [Nitrososphaerota archaeon]